MNAFLSKARDECKEQEESFAKCKAKFQSVVKIFCLKPKASDSEVMPEYFFSLWSTFCLDFKNAWKRETQKLSKQRLNIFIFLKCFKLSKNNGILLLVHPKMNHFENH